MEVVRLMEEVNSYSAPPQHHHSSHPTIGFPLGTALLLIVVFSISGIFSCCYHWDKLRHLRGVVDLESDDATSKPNPVYPEIRREVEESLPVIMPGDRFARFIAMPCPCEPPRQARNYMTVEEIQTSTPKPQHILISTT